MCWFFGWVDASGTPSGMKFRLSWTCLRSPHTRAETNSTDCGIYVLESDPQSGLIGQAAAPGPYPGIGVGPNPQQSLDEDPTSPNGGWRLSTAEDEAGSEDFTNSEPGGF